MKAKHKYVVGFVGENQCVYGKDRYSETYECEVASFTHPLTLWQAKRQLKKLSSGKKTIYELKPIKTKVKK